MDDEEPTERVLGVSRVSGPRTGVGCWLWGKSSVLSAIAALRVSKVSVSLRGFLGRDCAAGGALSSGEIDCDISFESAVFVRDCDSCVRSCNGFWKDSVPGLGCSIFKGILSPSGAVVEEVPRGCVLRWPVEFKESAEWLCRVRLSSAVELESVGREVLGRSGAELPRELPVDEPGARGGPSCWGS